MANSFLESIQKKRNEIILSNTMRRSTLDTMQRSNIYSELNNIYTNDSYPSVDCKEIQTDFEQEYNVKKNNNLCASITSSVLVSLTLLTANNLLLYYFTNVELN